MNVFRKILICYKQSHEPARALSAEISRWLNQNGVESVMMEAGGAALPLRPDCVIVPGGDGTILGVARKLAGSGIPVFGINFGRVGFLTSAGQGNWQKIFASALAGELSVRKFMALRFQIERQGKPAGQGVAANDVVVSRYFPARLAAMEVKVGDATLGALRSDGIIICTPLGSSGYSISAGGPIMYADMDTIGITPICPFPTGLAPLVIHAGLSVELRILPASADCYLTVDGQDSFPLEKDDLVRLQGWPGALAFLTAENQFLDHLRHRGFVLENIS